MRSCMDPAETVDTDGDNIGNNADPDDDNDGVDDLSDVFPLDPSESEDADGDNIGNNADPDDDNDGVDDLSDVFPLDSEVSLRMPTATTSAITRIPTMITTVSRIRTMRSRWTLQRR